MKNKLLYIAYIFIILGYSMFAYLKPFYAWDLLPYIGCALSYTESDENQIHQETYDIVKSSVPSEAYGGLVTDSPGEPNYRSKLVNDPHAFAEQFNFYRARYLYTFLIFVAYSIGLPVLPSMVLISILSALITMLLIYSWLSSYYRGFSAVFISLLLISVSGILGIARWTTPDSLSTFLIVLSLYVCLKRERPVIGLVIMMVSVLIRPDNIILFGFIATAYLGFGVDIKRWLILVGSAIALFLIVSITANTYSWQVLISHSFLSLNIAPAENVISFSALWYIKLLLSGLEGFYTSRIAFFIFLAVVTMGTVRLFAKKWDISLRLMIAIIATVCLRYLLFPCFENRHFVAINILLALISITAIVNMRIQKNHQN